MEFVRLMVPELLQQDFLHHYHTNLEGGNQCIGRTYQRIRSNSHLRGLDRSVQRYVGECVDCTTEKKNLFFVVNLRGMSKPLIPLK